MDEGRVFRYTVDLDKDLNKTILRDLFVTENQNAHTFRLKIVRRGTPVDLSGASVIGYFNRYKTRETVPLADGRIEGSEAVLTLSPACYAERTMFAVMINISIGDLDLTVFTGEGQMLANRYDKIDNSDGTIPTLDDLLAQITVMKEATADSRTAAQEARGAAETANQAAENIDEKVAEANAELSGKVGQLSEEIDGLNIRTTMPDVVDHFVSGYIVTNTGIGTTVDLNKVTSNSAYVHKVIPCKAGDQFYIVGFGAANPLLWTFTDTDKVIVDAPDGKVYTKGMKLTAAQDGYFIFNSSVNAGADYTPAITHTTFFSADRNNKRIGKIETALTEERIIDDFSIGYITTNTGVGTVVDINWIVQNSAYVHKVIPCKAGDQFYIVGFGAANPLLWTFTDTDKVIVDAADGKVYTEGMTLTAAQDGYFVFNSSKNAGAKYTPYVKHTLAFDATREHNEAEAEKTQIEAPMYFCAHVPDEYIVFDSVSQGKTTVLTLDEIYTGYDALVSAYPDYVTKTQIGMDASDTYPIWRYDFTRMQVRMDMDDYNAFQQSDAPKIIANACIHGDEKPCARALLNVMTAIAGAAMENNALGWLRTNVNFCIIPILNPYGYVHNQRYNANGVDLGRNYHDNWTYSDVESGRYSGEAPLTEAESQIVDTMMQAESAIAYVDLHTHGNFTSYDNMTYFETCVSHRRALQRLGFGVITELTKSGWTRHGLPLDSGYIGMLSNPQNKTGRASAQDRRWGMPILTPECMYRYYDGKTGADYSEDVNCMNAELVANIFVKLAKEFIH